jgi:hypothetical protein
MDDNIVINEDSTKLVKTTRAKTNGCTLLTDNQQGRQNILDKTQDKYIQKELDEKYKRHQYDRGISSRSGPKPVWSQTIRPQFFIIIIIVFMSFFF